MIKRKTVTVDGNGAAAYVAYAFTEVAAIYPISPSSGIGENIDEMASQGKKNIFDRVVDVVEMQSEAGASGTVHGLLQGGTLTSTYTASQGLLLMIPNMYKIAGELLPGVFYVTARAIAAQALSIFGDHQDVMATRQTGFSLLAVSGVQEIMDLAPVAHLSAIKGRVPFMVFYDGYRTSHEVQKVEAFEYDDLKKLVDLDALNEFKQRGLNPGNPVTRGTAQNPDIYFQAREASNNFYKNLPEVVEGYMNKINELTGKNYKLFNYYGAPDAERIIVCMGSASETAEETVDYLISKGEKVGVLIVHLYRPFSVKHLLNEIPSSVKKIAVLDRTKEPGAEGEPLYKDVMSAFYGTDRHPIIVGGRYGLASKEVTPTHLASVFEILKSDNPKNGFTVGIVDDVTNTSIDLIDDVVAEDSSLISCKFWGLGSDGTVGANKMAIKIIGDNTKKHVQAYFEYDSKKSGGITISHLRFGDNRIRSTYGIVKADFVACHNQAYMSKYDNIVSGVKDGGTFLLNTLWSVEELEQKLPAHAKRIIAQNNIKFYTINAVKIARDLGLGGRINMIMQSAFFKLANIIPVEDAIKYLKESAEKAYGKKGEKIVKMNFDAIDAGVNALVEVNVPESWKNAVDEKNVETCTSGMVKTDFVKNILEPVNSLKGNSLPVSVFKDREDGTFDHGTSKFEKRGIAVTVPKWNPETCIQCNMCAFVCPHAVIRPFLLNDKEIKNAPEGYLYADAKGIKTDEKLSFSMQVSIEDCTGCGNCVDVCPSKPKSLEMVSTDEERSLNKQGHYDYSFDSSKVKVKKNPLPLTTVKASQFEEPLMEFSGACAGCGETPYSKLVTQLFGPRMIISNATGCSSIWGGSVPAMPYTKNHEGRGPAWANSLFEDAAEFGYGLYLSSKNKRYQNVKLVESLINDSSISSELKDLLGEWKNNFNDGDRTLELYRKIVPLLEKESANNIVREILNNKEFLVKTSNWIFGGDGWAYDIGFGGLDHVIAQNEDINILVFDTETYSNTGGQSSKSTPFGAIAKFAAQGKRIKKKNLAAMAMSYGYVYVAQVSLSADFNQTLKAIKEAEAYPGPSIVIAYSQCISHGILTGMGTAQKQAKRAIEAGHWALFRYNPELKDQGKNPFILDSKEPTQDFKEYMRSEIRFSALSKVTPDKVEEIFDQAAKDVEEKNRQYRNLAGLE